MCMCPSRPNVNGTLGYIWNTPNGTPGIHPVNPPDIEATDTLLFDEPGRCGGLDCHSYHYRVVKRLSSVWLLVRHGGAPEAFRLSTTPLFLGTLAAMDTHARYWMLHTIYHAHSDAQRDAKDRTADYWRRAAAEKRIKVRKVRGRASARVTIIPPAA